MSVALDQNNQLVNIEQVEKGLDCNCHCFECNEPVIAKKGAINEHHFAHASNKESCHISPESILHKFAKEVILNEKLLTLPALPNEQFQNAKIWQFEKVIAEQAVGNIRPDLVASIGKEMIFIEIAVTSFVDEDKLALIKNLNIPTVEIDLREINDMNIQIPSEQIKQYILQKVDNKQWLHPERNIVKAKAEKSPQNTEKNAQTEETQTAEAFDKGFQKYRMTIHDVWVDVTVFNSGMVSVRTVGYNPQIKDLLKSWRNQGGGQYNPKYKSWNYYKPFSDTVLARLQELDSTPKT